MTDTERPVPPPHLDWVYTRHEVAALLKVGLTTVTGLIGSGQLPSFTIGRTRLVREEDLRAFINARAAAFARARRF